MSTRTGVILLLLLVVSGCSDGSGPPAAGDPASAAHLATPSSEPSTGEASPRQHVEPPCEPGGGRPQPRAGCPDPDPDTGWVRRRSDGQLELTPFRTYTTDAEGRAYADAHGIDFPFPNDYLDAPDGTPRPLELGDRTVCTASIRIDPERGIRDHVVDCTLLRSAASRADDVPIPVAVWIAHGEVVQVSELYRP